MDPDAARAEAARWLERLRIPPSLWQLPPATFSGGEQQRINIARSFIRTRPLLLLDEPTASLDPLNSATVIELIRAAREQGVGIVGIFHDPDVAEAVASRSVAMQAPSS
jgi:alpha-D-ribose 1-methylphosphonate 5-triphosphate synthase subunit PhnL